MAWSRARLPASAASSTTGDGMARPGCPVGSGIARDRRHPRRPTGARIKRGQPRFGALPKGKRYFEAPRRKQVAKPLRPFDQRNAFGECVLDPELQRVFMGTKPEKVELPNGGRILPIDLQECESGTRNLFLATASSAD